MGLAKCSTNEIEWFLDRASQEALFRVFQQGILFSLFSTGSTQENKLDMTEKTVDWNVKHQTNK